MSGTHVALVAVNCACPRQDCPRHGNCAACRLYHANSSRTRLPYCQRKRSWFQRLLGRTLEAIDRLSVDMRAVIDLVVDSDISYQDAALQLGVPIGTVRSRLALARGQLKMSVYAGSAHQ